MDHAPNHSITFTQWKINRHLLPYVIYVKIRKGPHSGYKGFRWCNTMGARVKWMHIPNVPSYSTMQYMGLKMLIVLSWFLWNDQGSLPMLPCVGCPSNRWSLCHSQQRQHGLPSVFFHSQNFMAEGCSGDDQCMPMELPCWLFHI